MQHVHCNDGTEGGGLPHQTNQIGGDNDNEIMGDFRSNKRSGKWSKFKDIPVHGDPIIGKENHMIRFYFENVDGLVLPMKNNNKQLIKNDKQTYLNQLFSRLEVDIFGGVEIRQQHDLVPPLQRLGK